MSLEGWIITLTLLIIVGLWNITPLLQRKQGANASTQKQYERLLTHYERVLNNIRDLDEDHATGKIQIEDYAQEREEWVQRGIQVLMAFDELGYKTPALPRVEAKTGAEIERTVDRQIEAAVAAYRKKSARQIAKS